LNSNYLAGFLVGDTFGFAKDTGLDAAGAWTAVVVSLGKVFRESGGRDRNSKSGNCHTGHGDDGGELHDAAWSMECESRLSWLKTCVYSLSLGMGQLYRQRELSIRTGTRILDVKYVPDPPLLCYDLWIT
jgi:hypothetical protein